LKICWNKQQTPILAKKDFKNETLNFLKKVGDFDKPIKAFVDLTQGKTYGK